MKKAVKKVVKKKTTPKKVSMIGDRLARELVKTNDILAQLPFTAGDRMVPRPAFPGLQALAAPRDLKSDNVMTQAEAIIYGDREKTYGHPSLNLYTIAQFWTTYVKRKAAVCRAQNLPMMNGVPDITIDDVCQMMVLLKTARLLNDPSHHDSQVDQVGYIALQERCREQ